MIVQRYGVFVALGLLAGVSAAVREARRRRLDAEAVFDACLWATIAGIAGARAEHVLFNLPAYFSRPAGILALSEGGLSIHGALIAGTLVVWLLCRKKGLPFRLVADTLAPAVALGEAVGRLGCDLVGRPGAWPLALSVDGVRFANVPLYSSAYLFALFAYLWFHRRRRAHVPGEVALSYAFWYSAGRFALEFARVSPPALLGLSLAQLVSAGLAALAAGARVLLSRRG